MSFFSFPSFLILRSSQAMSPCLPSAYSVLKHPTQPQFAPWQTPRKTVAAAADQKDVSFLPHNLLHSNSPLSSFYSACWQWSSCHCAIFNHEEHLHLGLRGSSQQSCLASGEHSDATFIKTFMRTTEVHEQVNIFPIFNDFWLQMNRHFETCPSERIFCGIRGFPCHPP